MILFLPFTAKLNSCLEQMHNILGESTPEHLLIDAIIQADYDHERALNYVLSQQGRYHNIQLIKQISDVDHA